jgi:hypothetical protein
MATWNLHIVASKPIEDVTELSAEIGKLISSYEHEVVSVTLTTDEGVTDVTPPPVAPTEPPPAGDTESAAPPAEVPTDTPPVA